MACLRRQLSLGYHVFFTFIEIVSHESYICIYVYIIFDNPPTAVQRLFSKKANVHLERQTTTLYAARRKTKPCLQFTLGAITMASASDPSLLVHSGFEKTLAGEGL